MVLGHSGPLLVLPELGEGQSRPIRAKLGFSGLAHSFEDDFDVGDTPKMPLHLRVFQDNC